MTSLAKSLPGAMICNVAMLYGYRAGGLLGGLLYVLGMSVPPMVILILISFCYSAFRDNYWVMAAMEGMQAAVIPIIGIVVLVLLMKYKVSIPKVLLFSVGMGLVFFGVLGI